MNFKKGLCWIYGHDYEPQEDNLFDEYGNPFLVFKCTRCDSERMDRELSGIDTFNLYSKKGKLLDTQQQQIDISDVEKNIPVKHCKICGARLSIVPIDKLLFRYWCPRCQR